MRLIKVSKKGMLKGANDKASSLAVGGHGCGNHSDMDLFVLLFDIEERVPCEKRDKRQLSFNF